MLDNKTKAKQILEEIKANDSIIKAKRLKIQLLTTKVEGGAIRYDKLNVKSSVSNFTEELLADIADLELEVEEDLAQADEQYARAYRSIKSMKDISEQNILLGYYFDGFTYDQIAVEMNVSRRCIGTFRRIIIKK